MASRKRALLAPTDDWEQRQFQLDWTEQTRYELIRPVVVFGAPRGNDTAAMCTHSSGLVFLRTASSGVLPTNGAEHDELHHTAELTIVSRIGVLTGLVATEELIAADAQKPLSLAVELLAGLVVEEADRLNLIWCDCHGRLLKCSTFSVTHDLDARVSRTEQDGCYCPPR